MNEAVGAGRRPVDASGAIAPGDRIALAAALLLYALWIAWAGWSRTALGYGTETDFLGGFVPEARRFLAGEPLRSEFHPPLYAMLLGGVHAVVGDWVRAGLLIAFAGGGAALVAAFALFRGLYGPAYGAAALAGLVAAPIFLAYAVSATSDILFLALFLASCAAAVAAARRHGVLAAAAAGLLIGTSVLLRTNGITLVLLAGLPLLAPGTWPARLRTAAVMLAAFALALLAMAAFARATGSSILPTGTVDNLAMTFHVDNADRISGESLEEVRGRFRSPVDVLLHDPVRVAKVYLSELWRLFSAGIPALLASPLAYLFAPGLVWLLLRRTDPLALGVLVVFAAQIALLNLKQFEPRYFLYLAPLLGGGLLATAMLLRNATEGFARRIVAVAGAALLGLGVLNAAATAADYVGVRSREVVDLLAKGVPGRVPADAVVVARKPHLAFYAGVPTVATPNVSDLATLRAELARIADGRPVFLFVGELEASLRPQLRELRDPAFAPAWLTPVERSSPPGRWMLYRLRPDAGG